MQRETSGVVAKSLFCLGLVVVMLGAVGAQGQAVRLSAKFNSSYGWVAPGETYPFFVQYDAGAAGATAVVVKVTLPSTAVFVNATPAPSSGSGSSTSPLTWNVGALAPNASGRIMVRARA